MKKLIFALLVVAAVLVVAMPVAAQGPFPYNSVANWYNRTAEMSATWAGDPFGGNARLAIEVKYEPDGKGGVAAKYANASWPYQGIVAKFGLQPYGPDQILPGGIPSSMSGDGSGPRKAIYIGGAWTDGSTVNPVGNYYWDPNGDDANFYKARRPNETPFELPACATVKIPAGSSKWFKLDTWTKDNAGRRLQTEIWLDDELDGATKPSGSAVFGAANKYYLGTAPMDGWSTNVFYGANAMDEAEINGYFMYVYSPTVLAPNYAFAPPNAFIFTLDVSGTGGLRRSCNSAAYAGQPCVPASKGGPMAGAGNSLTGMQGLITSQDGAGKNNVNYFDFAEFNPSQPSHLLWYSTNGDGWYFLRVWNQMIWDGTASVCSYRRVQP